MKSKCFYIFLLLLLSCFPAISFGSEGVVSQQPSRNESKINADIRFKELEGNYSDLKSKFEEQQRVLKDDLGEIISIQDNKIISYADWTTITLACVAVLVTVLGVLIAILSVWGYKNIAREAKNSAEAVSTLCLKNDVLLAFPPSDLEVLSWQDVTRFPIRVGH